MGHSHHLGVANQPPVSAFATEMVAVFMPQARRADQFRLRTSRDQLMHRLYSTVEEKDGARRLVGQSILAAGGDAVVAADRGGIIGSGTAVPSGSLVMTQTGRSVSLWI